MYERLGMNKNNWVFQEDGDPKHQSKMTKKWKSRMGFGKVKYRIRDRTRIRDKIFKIEYLFSKE